MQAKLFTKTLRGCWILQMNAREWFSEALAAESKAYDAKTAAARQRHGRNAIDALMVAASLGSHDAHLQLGIHYQRGAFGIIPARLDIAEHWLRLAATAPDGTCMLPLATLLMETGRKAEGRRWFRKALARGDGGAACHIGREFERRSPSRALRWYLKGVALGDPVAALMAGQVLEDRKSRRALLQAEAMYKKAVQKQVPGADEDLERVRHKLISSR